MAIISHMVPLTRLFPLLALSSLILSFLSSPLSLQITDASCGFNVTMLGSFHFVIFPEYISTIDCLLIIVRKRKERKGEELSFILLFSF